MNMWHGVWSSGYYMAVLVVVRASGYEDVTDRKRYHDEHNLFGRT